MDRALQGQVAGGKNVRVADAEEQVNFRSPPADPFQPPQGGDCLVCRCIVQTGEIKAVAYRRRGRRQRADFRTRQAGRTKGVFWCLQEILGGKRVDARLDTIPDRFSRRGRDLLRRDDCRKPLETAIAAPERKRPGDVGHALQAWIRREKPGNRLAEIRFGLNTPQS